METEKKVSRDMTKMYANVRKKWFVYDLLTLILCYDSIGKLFWNDRDRYEGEFQDKDKKEYER